MEIIGWKSSAAGGKQLWDIWESVRGGFEKIQVRREVREPRRVNTKARSDGPRDVFGSRTVGTDEEEDET